VIYSNIWCVQYPVITVCKDDCFWWYVYWHVFFF